MRRKKTSCCVRQLGGGIRRPPGQPAAATVPVRPGAAEPSSPFLVACRQFSPAPASDLCSQCGLAAAAHRGP